MRTHSISRLALLGLLLAGSASAQPLYRSVDANGRVTYSDRPPASANANAGPSPAGAQGPATAGNEGASAGLPYALRQTAQRYPVTLYTQANCEPCANGRTLLQTRGIPFNERTIGSAQDAAALEQLSGQSSLPLLTLGSQQLKGFSETEWSRYLDAAGYPSSNQLPPGYRPPPAQPMVAASPAAPAASSPPASAARPAPAAPALPPPAGTPTPQNPAGIRF